jgi:dephospho-CoA kinase
MLRVGLTGGIASGKSVVAKKLLDLGAYIIDADKISRVVMRPETECWKKIVAAFGKGILQSDSTIDRKKLASIVYGDPSKRNTLNHIVHPAIKRTIEEELEMISTESPDAIVIIEAALLVETGAYREYDKLIVVHAPIELQIERMIRRDGITGEEARKRIDAQWPIEKKIKAADYPICNEGSLDTLYSETAKVFSSLLSIVNERDLRKEGSTETKEKQIKNT